MKKKIKAWACVGDSGIYIPGGNLAIFITKKECKDIGATNDEIVPCTITYEIKKGK